MQCEVNNYLKGDFQKYNLRQITLLVKKIPIGRRLRLAEEIEAEVKLRALPVTEEVKKALLLLRKEDGKNAPNRKGNNPADR